MTTEGGKGTLCYVMLDIYRIRQTNLYVEGAFSISEG